jgi:two-component system nitrate/nitrite response regulator NarL
MSNTNILLVDDDDIANFISEKVLRNLGCDDINAVTDGKQAYDRLKKNCPNLVFLDINMPVMDGFAFLAKIGQELLCEQMNVVILTSSNRKKDRDKASEFSIVVDYLEKPLTQEKVRQVLNKIG